MPSAAISRRAFLRSALGLGAAGLAASLPLAGCQQATYPAHLHTLNFLSDKEHAVLSAAAGRLIPAGPGRPSGIESGVADFADVLFSHGNPRLQADIKKLLNTFEDMTVLALRFRPFTTMAPAEQDAYLRAWSDSPLGLQRQAFVGLNRLATMLHYMDARTWPGIGFAGPWVGKVNAGYGLDNQGPMSAPVNPNVFARYPA
ncbi:MAG: gluconate 2-dehydrogenase subunit 3 family protein [Candidatus Sericytochromatia bacterium]